MTIDNTLDKLRLHKAPMKLKIILAKAFIRTLSVGYLENDICLFNELNLWIETNGRPTTSNTNYWLNKH